MRPYHGEEEQRGDATRIGLPATGGDLFTDSEAQTAVWTRWDLKHRVHTLMRRAAPAITP